MKSFFKKIKTKRFLIRILAGAFLVAIIYVYVKYLFPYTLVIGFFLYFLIGILLQLSGLITLFKDLKNQKRLSAKIFESFPKKKNSLINKIKFIANTILANLLSVIIWPFGIYLSLFNLSYKRKFSTKNWIFEFDLKITDHIIGIILILVLGICYLFKITNLNDFGYGLIMLYAIAFAYIFKHLIYILHVDGLPAKLRKRANKPFTFFLIILIIDFIGIVLTISFIEATYLGFKVSSEGILNTIISFVDFKEQTKKMFFNDNLLFFEVIKVLSIWLFYYSFISHVFKLKSFNKNNEDILWMMKRNNSLCKFAKNLKIAKRVQNKTESISKQEVISLIGINDIEGAKTILRKTHSDSSQDEERNMYLMLLSISLHYDFDRDVIYELVKDSIIVGVEDLMVCGVLRLLAHDYNVQKDLLDIFIKLEKDFPLTLIELLILNGHYQEAVATINKNIEQINSNSVKVVMYKQLFECKVSHAENRKEFNNMISSWNDNTLDKFEKLVYDVEDKKELLCVYEHFTYMYASVKVSDSDEIHRFHKIKNDIKKLIEKDDFSNFVLSAIEDRQVKIEKLLSNFFNN